MRHWIICFIVIAVILIAIGAFLPDAVQATLDVL